MRKLLSSAALGAALVLSLAGAHAEDIDLFANAAPTAAAARPNILIVVDNSANWSAANQQWPGGLKQGQAELRALRAWVGTLQDNVNVGLMMVTAGSDANKDGP